MSVALDVAQFNVEDCPRSIERGSAPKLEIDGFAGGGGRGASTLGAGGGGGAGAFFLHPAEKTNSTLASKTTLVLLTMIVRLLILKLAS